jgi:hypothetical protein
LPALLSALASCADAGVYAAAPTIAAAATNIAVVVIMLFLTVTFTLLTSLIAGFRPLLI